jgi:hypothetical protein
MKRKGLTGEWMKFRTVFAFCTMLLALCALLTAPFAYGADKLVVKDGGGNTKFVVDDSGQVGIGTATPAYPLDVEKEGNADSIIVMQAASDGFQYKPALLFKRSRGTLSNPTGVQEGDWLMAMFINAHNGIGYNTNNWRVFDIEASETWNATNRGFRYSFFTRANGASSITERLRIDHNGNIGIGTTTPSNLLTLSGGAYSDGLAWYPACSREYKENIKELSTGDAVRTLLGLNPVTYNYKNDKDTHRAGFIAEDVPELIATKDRKSVGQLDIMAVLTKVVQEQNKTITELKEKVSELERIIKLKTSLASR